MCTDQCYKNGQKLIETRVDPRSLPSDHAIHDTGFYEQNGKECGCIHTTDRYMNTWKALGSGPCLDTKSKLLFTGYYVSSKETGPKRGGEAVGGWTEYAGGWLAS